MESVILTDFSVVDVLSLQQRC